MRTIRVHLPLPLQVGATVAVPDDTAHHLCKVLRLGAGDVLHVFNAEDGEYQARLIDASTRSATVACESALAPMPESPLNITLVQALATGDRVDNAIQKVTELGVRAVTLFSAERSQGKLSGARQDKKLAHWQRIAVSATEQCGRCVVPAVEFVRGGLPAPRAPLALLLDPLAEGSLASLPKHQTIELAIGPEGGFSDQELQRAAAMGWTSVRCGPRVLRTETAGPAVIAALQSLRGDWT